MTNSFLLHVYLAFKYTVLGAQYITRRKRKLVKLLPIKSFVLQVLKASI